MSNSRKVIRRKSVKEKSGLSYPQIWRKSTDPDDDFPMAVRLGPSAIGWFENEIDEWVASRPRVHKGQSHSGLNPSAAGNQPAKEAVRMIAVLSPLTTQKRAPTGKRGALSVSSSTTITEIYDNAYIHAPDPKDK